MKVATALVCVTAVALGAIALQRGGSSTEAWHHPEDSVLSGEVPDGYHVVRFDVEGMCCRSCPQKLAEQLALVDGVVDSSVRFETKRAEVVVPNDFDPEPLLEVLNQDKYTARVAP